jgi:hypothetical protein
MTETQTLPNEIRVGRHSFPLDPETGWCVPLQAWIVRQPDGHLATIPANDRSF